MRGSTFSFAASTSSKQVYLACVIDLSFRVHSLKTPSLPACADRPLGLGVVVIASAVYPGMRIDPHTPELGQVCMGLPACVGIDLSRAALRDAARVYPACGGSTHRPDTRPSSVVYPHARGSTISRLNSPYGLKVYPACAIDLKANRGSGTYPSLPACADRPHHAVGPDELPVYSACADRPRRRLFSSKG